MILKILPDTHPNLRKICNPADPTNLKHKLHAMNLVETMRSHGAFGVASNQTYSPLQICVIAVNLPEFSGPMFNPEIIEASEEVFSVKEGCLSTKERLSVPRAKNIKVRFRDLVNNLRILELSELSAVVIQHEVDHLKGRLITDYL